MTSLVRGRFGPCMQGTFEHRTCRDRAPHNTPRCTTRLHAASLRMTAVRTSKRLPLVDAKPYHAAAAGGPSHASVAAPPAHHHQVARELRRAAVVGAGPAGAACAISLAKLGFKVDVIERRPDPATSGPERQQTFIMNLNLRATGPLRMLGVRLPEDQWLGELAPVQGMVQHLATGKVGDQSLAARDHCPADGLQDSMPPANIVPAPKGTFNAERGALSAHVVEEARRLHPDLITFHFSVTLEELDLPSRRLRLRAAGGDAQQLTYDLLVGADGTGSRVRDALAHAVHGFRCQRVMSEMGYLIARDLPAADGIVPEGGHPEPDSGRYIHFFVRRERKNLARGFAAYVGRNGRYNAIVIIEGNTLPPAFQDAAAFEAELLRDIPHMPKSWAPLIAQQCVSSQGHSWGSTVRCSQLVGPSVVLIGDAAHGVTPNLGQGCNSAIEDVGLLHKVLCDYIKAENGLQAALDEYDARRRPDVHALAHLNLIAPQMQGFGPLGKLHPEFFVSLCHMIIGSRLHRLFPAVVAPAMMTATSLTVPYRTIMIARYRDFCIALGLLGLVVALAVRLLF